MQPPICLPSSPFGFFWNSSFLLTEWQKVTLAASYNHFHNILRLFDVLPNFPFTYKHSIYELPNDLRLRRLGNMRKVSGLHRIIA